VWASGIASSSEGCPECKNTNLGFEKSFFVSDNIEPTRTLIHQFKYKKHMCLAIPLGSLLANLLHQKAICEILSIPISTSNLFRVKNTLSQTQLSRTQRQKNVKGAFKVKNPEAFYQKNILLADDVLTTGMTASKCAKSLKNAGTNKVFLIALAKSNM